MGRFDYPVPEMPGEYYAPAYEPSPYPVVPEETYSEILNAPSSSGWWGSFWQEAKDIAKVGARTYESIVRSKSGYKGSLFDEQYPTRIEKWVEPWREPEKSDYEFFTPYPRADSGTKPTIITAAPGLGISPMLLLAGAAVVFLMMRKGK